MTHLRGQMRLQITKDLMMAIDGVLNENDILQEQYPQWAVI